MISTDDFDNPNLLDLADGDLVEVFWPGLDQPWPAVVVKFTNLNDTYWKYDTDTTSPFGAFPFTLAMKWRRRGVSIKSTGHKCSKCGLMNEFAASNQPGGGYVCYECR